MGAKFRRILVATGLAGGLFPAVVQGYGPAVGVTAAPAEELRVSLSAAMREDELVWDIAGNMFGSNPNILSELTWTNLSSSPVEARGSYRLGELEFSGVIMAGDIYAGDNQDSDYNLDNRQGEFSRSVNSGGGDVLDWRIGVGRLFPLGNGHVVAQVGYGVHEQNLTIFNGRQVIPDTGAISGLNSSYDAAWSGPWLGVSLEQSALLGQVELAAEAQFHHVDFEGVANWNLRTDLAQPKSFEHETTATGFVLGIRGSYRLWRGWRLRGGWQMADWQGKAGLDRVYTSSGKIYLTRLNGVSWQSSLFSVGVELRY